MGIRLDSLKLAEITGAKLFSKEAILFEELEFDSRNIKGGELFIALPGENDHGHRFVAQALSRGAALCLVEKVSECPGAEKGRLVEVKDALKAFQDLSAWWRMERGVPIGAVTGSVGKTTVKELAACILLDSGVGSYSRKSFNNHTGVPYSLSHINSRHNWAVIEMGMNHPGELTRLSGIVKPDLALVTAIAPVHQEFFKTLEDIARAKLEILTGLKEGGTVILNADDPILMKVFKEEFNFSGRVITFGEKETASFKIVDVKQKGLEAISCAIEHVGKQYVYNLNMPGRHNAWNLTAALALAMTLRDQVNPDNVQSALNRFVRPPMRLNQFRTEKGRIIIDDCYNANPASMKALIDIAESVAEEKTVGFVLGDMLELGENAAGFHKEIGQRAVALKPEFIIGVGREALRYIEEAQKADIPAFHAETPEAAAHIVSKYNTECVFIKASRGIALDRTVRTLLNTEGEVIAQPEEN